MTVTAYIALGSNLGDRKENLGRALLLLRNSPGITVKKVSSYHETEPVGGPPGQAKYLNAAAELETHLEPQRLLEVLLEVENKLGRVRTEKNAPRTIDLDLLLYGAVVSPGPELILPHPLMHERLFVLEPLTEIASQAVYPRLDITVRELLEILHGEQDLEEAWQELQRIIGEHAEIRNAKTQAQSKEETLTLRVREQEVDAKARALFAEIEMGQDQLRALKRQSGLPKASGLVTKFLDRDLRGLRAVVTGATSGIGAAIALELAAGGAQVIVHGRRLAAAQTVGERIGKFMSLESALFSTKLHSAYVLADLREPAECERLARTAWDAWNGLDIWINNAGADTLTGEAADWPFERKLDELLAVDLKATMLLSREVGQRMKHRGRGVILNIGWDQAETGMEGDSGQLFGATKGAVMAFTKSLAATLAPEVRVNCLAPGWIRTAWGAGASQRWQERVRKETLLQRWGTPEDVAAAAHWLVSPAASFITGQVIRVNGGAVR